MAARNINNINVPALANRIRIITRLNHPTPRNTEELARNFDGNIKVLGLDVLLLTITPACSLMNIHRRNIIRRIGKYIWRGFNLFQKGFFTNLAQRINRYRARQLGQTMIYPKRQALNDFIYGWDFH
ncbi:27925_t:CDS:1 [Racocetra persica]|uniref:27925_t:CDS:1 n=1 Tax=Racocetra persica TaxID=160502 RepID=A0ACA9LH88_9GLOM|nr:27925_t:CDS:1 [Racocetra persica]